MIVGVDVDEDTLSQARSTCANVSSRVFMFKETALRALGTYDVIFANSVVCRHPWDPMPANFYTLSVFGETIATLSDVLRPIRNMHFKRWRRLRDGAPAPWEADTNAYKQRFWCHDRPRSEKNGGFGYARGIFHEETMSVYR